MKKKAKTKQKDTAKVRRFRLRDATLERLEAKKKSGQSWDRLFNDWLDGKAL